MLRFLKAIKSKTRFRLARHQSLPRTRGMLVEQLESRRVFVASILSTNFGTSGVLGSGVAQLTVTFSEPVLGANGLAFEIRRAGVDGLLGNADDPIIASTGVAYSSSTNIATLNFVGLVEDVHRLVVKDTIKDVAGNALDGDGDGIAGGNGQQDFVASNFAFAPDRTFGSGGIATTEFYNNPNSSESVEEVAVQTDGKIVAVGTGGVVRYLASGALDTSFGIAGKATFPGVAKSVAIQSDGKIVVAGYSIIVGTNPAVGPVSYSFALARYNQDGSIDTTFSGNGIIFLTSATRATSVAIQSDGKIVVAGGYDSDFMVRRFNWDGTLDTTFGTDIQNSSDYVESMAIQSDGKIVVAGYSFFGSSYHLAMTRYNTNGTLDATFDGDGILILSNTSDAYSVAIQSDGKIVTVGTGGVVRYLASGALDMSFGIAGKATFPGAARSVAIQSDGKIVVTGYSYGNNRADFALARYNVDGTLDTTFDGDGILVSPIGTADDFANSVAIQSDGKILVAGYKVVDATNNDFALARFNGNGSLDTSFNGDGKLTMSIGRSSETAFSVAIQSDGKVVVAGTSNNGSNVDFALARYNLNGSLDSTFDGEGMLITAMGTSTDIANSVAIQNDGKIVVGGYSYNGSNDDFALARYNPDGTLDSSFDGDGKLTLAIGTSIDRATNIAIQSDGKILAAGYSRNGFYDDFALARFNSDGSLDIAFDGDGILTTAIGTSTDIANSMAIQSDGKIVLAGYSLIGTGNDFAMARYNTNGALDATFGHGGKVTTDFGTVDDSASSIVIQSDGKIVVAGRSQSRTSPTYAFALSRYNVDGSLDTSFDWDGKQTASVGTSSTAYSVAIQNDGKIIMAGSCIRGFTDFALVRFNSNGSLDTTFNGDSKLNMDIGLSEDIAYSLAIQNDGKVVVAGHSVGDFAVVRFDPQDPLLSPRFSPSGQFFDIDTRGGGMGQLMQGSSNAFDGLNRLVVNGTVFGSATSPTMTDGDRTVVTPVTSIAGLDVYREVTVPNVGAQDFARTVDVFTNATGSAITVPVQFIGNLGSDAATTVFATSDGDLIVEPTDWWFATDDANETGGTPAIAHLLHGPFGLQPTSVSVTDDNVQWSYNLTVAPGETKRLATFTVLGTTRQQVIDSVNALVNSTVFGGQAAAFLTAGELASLANFQYNVSPTNLQISTSSIAENSGASAVVGSFSTADANIADGDTHSYSLVPGTGSTDNATFVISGSQLRAVSSFDFETKNDYSIRVRTTDSYGLLFEQTFTINVSDVNEPVVLTRANATVTGNVSTQLTNTGTWSDPEAGVVVLSASIGTVVKNANGTWDWSYVPTTYTNEQVVTIVAQDSGSLTSSVSFTMQAYSEIATRGVFYVGATGTSAATSLATDKRALLPGQSSTFANYTNYARGLNGVVIDIAGLPASTSDSQLLASLQLAQWNGIAAEGFSALPVAAVPSVSILSGSGEGGSSRVRITFPDNTLQNTWLRVTVLANADTGLAANDVFYFGNVIGELDLGNTATRLRVNGQDAALLLANQSPGANSAGVTNKFDLDRNGRVNGQDYAILLANQQAAGIVAPITAPSLRFGQRAISDGKGEAKKGHLVIPPGGFDESLIKKRRTQVEFSMNQLDGYFARLENETEMDHPV